MSTNRKKGKLAKALDLSSNSSPRPVTRGQLLQHPKKRSHDPAQLFLPCLSPEDFENGVASLSQP